MTFRPSIARFSLLSFAVAAQNQRPPEAAKPFRVTAPDISARILPLHPKPRDAREAATISTLENAHANQSRGMGNVGPEDGRLLRMLTELLDAKHVVELGTSNGYSALWLCLGLRSTGGRLTTHEIDASRIAQARENFRRAQVEDVVTLVEGDAHKTIRELKGPIDLVLLDAEKAGFVDYLKTLLPLVRRGGLILAHDSSLQADQLRDYYSVIASDAGLETVFVDASRWGLAISRKMR